MKIDLHTHTSASDGSFTPDELIQEAIEKELEILSITDHDTINAFDNISGIPEEIEFITGVEISAEFPTTLHILGYGFNTKNVKFRNTISELKKFREIRNKKMLKNMAEMKFHITWEELVKEAHGEIVGRPHFAKLMVKKNYVCSIQEAFDKYLKKGAPLYLNKKRLDPQKAIELILQADGIPVLAHPYQTKLQDNELENLIRNLVNFGLQGIEVFYSQNTILQRELYIYFAKEYNLLITGGSDFHGKNKPDINLGVDIPYSFIHSFLKKVQFYD